MANDRSMVGGTSEDDEYVASTADSAEEQQNCGADEHPAVDALRVRSPGSGTARRTNDRDSSELRLLTDGGEDEGDESEDEEENEDEEGDEDEEEEGGEDEEGDGRDEDEKTANEDGTTVLYLDLEGLFLNLLGLEVTLEEVELDASAVSGDGKLLGNLLDEVSGLLDDGLVNALGDLDGLGDVLPEDLVDADALPSGSDITKTITTAVVQALLDSLTESLGVDSEEDRSDDGDGSEDDEESDEE